jgi:hypothetical protein
MSLSLLVLWALVGWCGTVPRRWLWPPPPPEPGPDPWWLFSRVIGVIAGIIGGWAFTHVFGPLPEPWLTAGPRPEPWVSALPAAASALGAFVVARVATDIAGRLRAGSQLQALNPQPLPPIDAPGRR